MIVRYCIRALRSHPGSTLGAFSVLASTTAIVTVLFGFSNGLQASVRGGADPRVMMIVRDDRPVEAARLPNEVLGRARVLPGLASAPEGGAAVSPELVSTRPLVSKGGESLDAVLVRGVDPIALTVHANLHVRGRLPGVQEQAVVIGKKLLGTRPGFVEGGRIEFDGREWSVVGVLEGEHSPFESEVWCNRGTLGSLLHKDTSSVLALRLDPGASRSDLAAAVTGWKSEHLKAYSEADLYRDQLKEISLYFDVIYLLVAVLVASMIFNGANTIYTSFLGRIRELATLMVIGFTRRRVIAMMTFESMLLAGAGALFGTGLALLAQGHSFVVAEMGQVFAIELSPEVLLVGVFTSLVVGALASLVANLQIARMDILTALRE